MLTEFEFTVLSLREGIDEAMRHGNAMAAGIYARMLARYVAHSQAQAMVSAITREISAYKAVHIVSPGSLAGPWV